MQGFELEEIIKKFPSITSNFSGIFSIDTLPKHFKNHHFLFCNEDLSKNPGTHWLCFLRDHDSIECFDSLGFSDLKQKKFKPFLNFKEKIKCLKFNETQFQSDDSITCGLFVLYFAINRMHNLDLPFYDFLEEFFNINLSINENKVKLFFKN